MKSWLPHAISLCRMPLAFVLVITYRAEAAQVIASLIIFSLVAVTDKLDGFVARRLRIASYTGYLIDGFADRTFSVACILVAAGHHGLPLWIVLVAITRELLVYTCRLLNPSAWHPPSSLTRAHSLLVFAVTRLWFLGLLCIVLWGSLGHGDVARVIALINSVYGLTVLISLLATGDTLLRGMTRDA